MSESITGLLVAWRNGDENAGARLVELVYPELRKLARHSMRSERAEHTLQPTALVNEALLRLLSNESVDWQSRAHFMAIAARQLRRVLVDHARMAHRDKRGGDQVKLTLSAADAVGRGSETDLMALNEALERLATLDPRSAQVVELRFFGGLEAQEAAEALGISVSTLKRDWEFARAWLKTELAE
jgi:RNA polymerase sigma factor (TIGR02999 family)